MSVVYLFLYTVHALWVEASSGAFPLTSSDLPPMFGSPGKLAFEVLEGLPKIAPILR